MFTIDNRDLNVTLIGMITWAYVWVGLSLSSCRFVIHVASMSFFRCVLDREAGMQLCMIKKAALVVLITSLPVVVLTETLIF